jgi:hypothetical protein
MICVEKMTANEYGVYSLLLVPIMIAASFTGGLVGQPMLRFATVLTSEALHIGLFRLPFLSAIFSSLILILYLVFLEQSLVVMFLAVGLVMLSSILAVRRNYYVALSLPLNLLILDGTRTVAGVAILYILVKFGSLESHTPLIGLLGGCIVALIVVILVKKDRFDYGNQSINNDYLRYGVGTALWMVMIGLFPMLERMILNQHGGTTITGIYAAIADPFVAVISAFGAILVSVLMPRYVTAWNEQKHAEIRICTWIGVLSVVLFSCFCLLFSKLLMSVGNGRFLTLVNHNQLLSLMLVISTGIFQTGVFFHKPLELKNETHKMCLYLGISLIIFTILAELSVSRFGMLGVAFSKIMAAGSYIILLNSCFFKPAL